MQVALRALGLYCGPIDGIVGPQTRAAVTSAQKRAGLPQTGAIGVRTRESLGPLVRALAWMESGYQPGVVSLVGARGVMQVMPETGDFVERVLLRRPVPNTVDGDIEVGVLYLRHLLGRFEGDTRLALAAWYQGEAAVREFGLYAMTKPFVADVLALQSRM